MAVMGLRPPVAARAEPEAAVSRVEAGAVTGIPKMGTAGMVPVPGILKMVETVAMETTPEITETMAVVRRVPETAMEAGQTAAEMATVTEVEMVPEMAEVPAAAVEPAAAVQAMIM